MYFAFSRRCLGAWTGVSIWCPVPGACRDLGLRRRVLGNQASPHSIMNMSTFLLSLQVNGLTRRGPKLNVSGLSKSSINDMVRFLY